MRAATAVFVSLSLLGCKPGLLDPKGDIATKLSPMPENARLDPPPPAGVYWLRLRAGTVPATTPGNQPWDEGGGLPDPFAILFVDGKELFRTAPASDTYEPAWAIPSGNFEIPPSAQLEVLVRDDDPIGDDMIMGRAKIDPPSAGDLASGRMEIDIGRKGVLYLETEPAHALFGLGFDYYVQSSRMVVTEVWKYSPAARAGLEAGDEVVTLGGRTLSQMKDSAIRSAVNAISGNGMEAVVKHRSGTTATVLLKVGPVYALYGEYGTLP